ncbi:MAG TPA: acyl-CoA dehydrogenase [Candidatus Binatia bacterium]|jgi:alkylation response protein AidB-like acyl-CoA dehydrogenase|nr:acyl-CoA dehydrogenase [Candidatus Binatia bacterium]
MPDVQETRMPITTLSADEQLFREMVRGFAEEKVKPHVMEMDRAAKIPRELIDQFFAIGVMGIELPTVYGGAGANFLMAILAIEELARVDPSVAVCVDVQNTLVNNALLRWLTPEQKEQFLPRLARDVVGAYALSEPGSGSDAFAMTTQARLDGDSFILNGRKLWITNGAEAGLYLLFANADPAKGYKGITGFVVERDFPGFAVGKKEDKLGIRASSTCELILDDVRVPRANVVGEVGHGYKVAIETLNEGRIGIGAQMIGLAQGAFEAALAYAKERRQFGRVIADFQAIQFQLAELATEIEAGRLMVYNTARMKEAGQPFVRQAAMSKYFCSQVGERVASQALEIFGGVGFTKDFPAEKFYRDAKIGKIYEGTSNIQLQTIARTFLGR